MGSGLMQEVIKVETNGQGLYEITSEVHSRLNAQGVYQKEASGLVNLFIRHTSASLTIQENADPSARHDLERFLNFLVPEGHPEFTHTHEGPDDMPAHIKSVLTATSLNIPLVHGELGLGTWQGIYLWEHRRRSHTRSIIVTALF